MSESTHILAALLDAHASGFKDGAEFDAAAK